MVPSSKTPSRERVAILQWVASLGAVTAESLAEHECCGIASARAQLQAAVRAGMLSCTRPLHAKPALYAVTTAGLRASGTLGVEPCRITAANASHAIACALAAARLERAYPDHRVSGERELRSAERACGRPLASAALGVGPDGATLLHRPDLVLWPATGPGALPLAVEVELTVKAPRRLLGICMAWARCRCVTGVLYLASPPVLRPLARAIEQAQANDRIVVLALGDTVTLTQTLST